MLKAIGRLSMQVFRFFGHPAWSFVMLLTVVVGCWPCLVADFSHPGTIANVQMVWFLREAPSVLNTGGLVMGLLFFATGVIASVTLDTEENIRSFGQSFTALGTGVWGLVVFNHYGGGLVFVGLFALISGFFNLIGYLEAKGTAGNDTVAEPHPA